MDLALQRLGFHLFMCEDASHDVLRWDAEVIVLVDVNRRSRSVCPCHSLQCGGHASNAVGDPR